MSGTVWLDLTDLRAWSGHHTGVQRVVSQLARRFEARTVTRFFAFDAQRLLITEVSSATLTPSDPGHPNVSSPRRSMEDRFRSAARRVPVSVKRRLDLEQRAALRRAGRHVFDAAHEMRAAVRRPGRSDTTSDVVSSVLEVQSDDVIVVLGKVWDEPALVDQLSGLRLRSGCRLIYLVYDLIPVFQPHLFGPGLFERYAAYLFEACTTADGLLAISQSTRNDLQRFCAELLISPPPIEVVRLGEDADGDAEEPVPGLVPESFVLTVGTVEVRKNHALLYSTWKLARARGVALPRLVIVGGRGWLAGDVTHLITTDPEVADSIVMLQDVSDAQLTWLYRHCMFTVYPSVFEGWGLPVAESLAHGRLCLASNTSSMPEIAGELIDYFNPYDAGECLDAITRYLDAKRRAAKEQEIRERYRRTTWDDTFNQVERMVTQERR